MSAGLPNTHTVRILHVSDLHERVLPDGLPDDVRIAREGQIKRDRSRRPDVLNGTAWHQNLEWITSHRPYHLLVFTGDIADWGHPEEYLRANRIIKDLIDATGVDRTRFFCIPGNHDIQRHVNKDVFELLRARSGDIGAWLAGEEETPIGITADAREKMLARGSAFWDWVKRPLEDNGLGRPTLLPANHAHGRLGYHEVISDTSFPFQIHVVGLDTAWLAGDEHDAGKLRVTEEQLRHLTMENEQIISGFRIALGHHPLGDLAERDRAQCQRVLADRVDLYLHGHQHDAVTQFWADPDRSLRLIAAGCLFEGSTMNEHKNGFHIIEAQVRPNGQPTQYTMRFRAWSERGHWHDESALYRAAKGGVLTWAANKAAESDEENKQGDAAPQRPDRDLPYHFEVHRFPGAHHEFVIEMRPSQGAWLPFLIGVPIAEVDWASMMLTFGAKDHPSPDSASALFNVQYGTTNDWSWMQVGGNSATPDVSAYLMCKALPSKVIFGTLGRQYVIGLPQVQQMKNNPVA